MRIKRFSTSCNSMRAFCQVKLYNSMSWFKFALCLENNSALSHCLVLLFFVFDVAF